MGRVNRDVDEPKKPDVPWWLRAMLISGAVLLVISGGSLVALYGLSARYNNKVDREDILDGVPVTQDHSGPLNFLVLGSDTRSDDDTQSLDETGSRSDTIMLVHVNEAHTKAYIISIPRDSYVEIPAGGEWPGGKNKINSALAYGGANLAAKTVYELTQVPLNGAMIVNFNGVHRMVEAVGGVRVCTPFEVRSSFSAKVWGKGCHEMTPADAEEFIRQRKHVPGGDFGRIKNQQNVIKGLMQKATTAGILTNPGKLDSLISTAAESLTVDKDLNVRDLAFELKGLKPGDIEFATVPYKGTMRTEAGSSVELDMAAAEELFEAIREDRVDQWLAKNPQPDVASWSGSS